MVFIVVEADEMLREYFQEALSKEIKGDIIPFSSPEEVLKYLENAVTEVDGVIVGDPLWVDNHPLDDWTAFGKSLREKIEGRKIISFSCSCFEYPMGRDEWSDFNVSKPDLAALRKAIRQVKNN